MVRLDFMEDMEILKVHLRFVLMENGHMDVIIIGVLQKVHIFVSEYFSAATLVSLCSDIDFKYSIL